MRARPFKFLIFVAVLASLTAAVAKKEINPGISFRGIFMNRNEVFLYGYATGYRYAYAVGHSTGARASLDDDELRVFTSEQLGRFEQQKPKPEFMSNFSNGLKTGETEGLELGSRMTYETTGYNRGTDPILEQKVKLAVFDEAKKLDMTNAEALHVLDNYQKDRTPEMFRRF